MDLPAGYRWRLSGRYLYLLRDETTVGYTMRGARCCVAFTDIQTTRPKAVPFETLEEARGYLRLWAEWEERLAASLGHTEKVADSKPVRP